MSTKRTTTRLRVAAVLTAAGLLGAPAAAQAAIYPGPNGNQDVHGAIEAKWLALGKAPGAPLTSEQALPADSGEGYGAGAFNDFTHQAIYWTAATGAHTVGGDIYGYWAAHGWENSFMGYPTGDEESLTRGGVLQRFMGVKVYWLPGTGVHAVTGNFDDLWASSGWEKGRLGYPVAELADAAEGGDFQRFEFGAIYEQPDHSSTPGVAPPTAVSVSGAIFRYWAARNYERGSLGYPITEEMPLTRGGVLQRFQGGSVYWSPGNGAHEVTDAFADVWATPGWASGQWENGRLGYPTGDLAPAADGGTFQRFEHGAIYDQPDGSADPGVNPGDPVSVSGAFYPYWAANGYERGRLGWPLGEELNGDDPFYHATQVFQGGSLTWSLSTGVTEYPR